MSVRLNSCVLSYSRIELKSHLVLHVNSESLFWFKRPEKITSVGKKLVIAASFAAPVLLGVCIYVAQKFECFSFCDVCYDTKLML